jgi:PAS domain S-box-containing protein
MTREADHTARALRALTDLAIALSGTRTPDEVAAVIVDEGMKVAQADTCSLYRSTLATVAQLAVPQLADWCGITLVEPETHALQQVAVAHVDPEKVRLVRELGTRYPPNPEAPTGVPQVIRSGRSELYPELPWSMLEAAARDEDHLRILREMKLESAMVVPLLGRERTLGAMTFIVADSGRRYTEQDLAFAEEFARRAAMAIENALAVKHAEEGQVTLRRVAAAELRASEWRFHQLVDAVTDYAIFMLDATGHVETWNPGAQKTKGYEPHEIIGQHFSIFYTPEDRAAGRPEQILETVRREGRFEDESWRVRKDGTRFWANVIITALRGQKGQLTGFAKVTRDLSAKRAAEENERALVREQLARAASDAERQRLLTLLNHVPATVNFFRGPDLVFEFAHPKTLQKMGRRDLQGKALLVAAPELRQQAYVEHLRRVYASGESYEQREVEVCFEVDGRRVESYWDSVYLPVRGPSGAIEGVMTFELDVTDSVVARRELERVNRAKDEFLATMSHELRTPLNAITGWATILRRKPLDVHKLDRGLEVIERNAKAQARLVSDLLDVSRVISGKLQLSITKTEVLPLIVAASDVVRPAAEGKGVRLVVDVDPAIGTTMADPDRIQQIVWNLLSNAIRFTPRGGRVVITADRAASGIAIRVDDNGVGIAGEHLPHIFERFKQVDSSTTRAHGGLGLGLAIVRHLVEAHGGSVEAQSEGLGRGATFTIRLPIQAISVERAARAGSQALAEPADVTPNTASLQDVRVLLVDDDPDSLEVLRMVLEAAGAKVKATTSARDAFDALDTHGPFEIIVSDIGMPEMDGYSFMRSLRSQSSGANVPAIALTAYARSEDAELAKKAGYQEHLAKPVDERRLLDAVKTWSRRSPIQSAPLMG